MNSTTTPYSFIRCGQLFITPVGPSIAEVPYPTQTLTKPPDNSLWVHGEIVEPGLHLDRARMPPSLFQDIRDDLTRYSPIEVTRSAFRRSQHAYVGVIDSRGTPYYFALDSRGISVREVDRNDERVWKTFERLVEEERMAAVHKRRTAAAAEMVEVDRELSEPQLVLSRGLRAEQIGKLYASEMRRVGAELADQCSDEDLDPPCNDGLVRALPKNPKEEKVKKTPTVTASKKQAGAGGKTRYSYPQEKKGGAQTKKQQPVPLVVVHDDTKHANPHELANQLGVSVRTLQHAAKRLGREGFSKFMRSHLKRFAAKHRLDPDYWGTLYEKIRTLDVKAAY